MMKRVSITMMRSTRRCTAKTMLLFFSTLIPTTVIPAGAIALGFVNNALAAASDFGTANPFYAPSTLPFQAPPFDKIRDEDFQPAIEAGMAQAKAELLRIADNPDAPTFDNTIVAMEKSGRLFDRAMAAFDGVTGANTNPTLQNVKTIEAPKLAAHRDFLYLNTKLFARVSAIYNQRSTLKLDSESLRLLERSYDEFVHAGAKLSEADKTELRKLNEEISSLSNAFNTKLLAATKEGAFVTTDKAALAGLSEARIAAAAQAAKDRKVEGFVIPLQNTTQQPDLVSLSDRTTRQAIFERSWNRAEQVRKARYDIDDAQVKPYFEIDNVLQNGVFYAANQLYGITFKERHDIPVYHPDVRVFEVFDADGKHLALFYCDYFKRDNKNGGAWMSEFVGQSRLLGTSPVVYNVANLPKPAAGEPALISFTDVVTMFHEFGHALHGMFSNAEYPTLAGTSTARDFVEFPSQFNEHWATYPAIFAHYAKHYKTGEPMPQELAARIRKAEIFNKGYDMTELLAAAELDMQWHFLPPTAPLQNPDEFEKQALEKTHLDVSYVPPRYRSTYFSHIWESGYSAGYYAYLWTEMLADDGYQWFDEHGGLTRANGDRFRQMVLSRGNTEDLAKMYKNWRGAPPNAKAMLKHRGLEESALAK